MEDQTNTTTNKNNDHLKVLDALDSAKTQGYHLTAVIISGMGFFTDAYDLFSISLLTKLIGRLYYYDPATGIPGELPVSINAVVSGIALCGTLAGQLFFGWLGDRLGRKRVYGITSMIMVLFSLASGFSFGSSVKAVIGTLCFFRFWLGFGIGGDYPLSATIMSEYANTKTRGAFVAAVFAMQGVGILVAAVVTMAVAVVFMAAFSAPSFQDNPVLSTPPQADYVWRIVFMLGSVPAGLTYYWRMRMPETARYTALVAGDLERANADMSRVLQVDLTAASERKMIQASRTDSTAVVKTSGGGGFSLLSSQFAARHGLHLFVTTTTWFLQAFAFYSQQLFQKDIYTQVGFLKPARTMSALQEALSTARAQALVALCGTVPGYWATVFLIDRMGRKPIQLLGFLMMGTFLYALAVPYESFWRGEHLDPVSGKYSGGHNVGFVVLFALTFFFANFGPNSTTFIVPAEIFPARLRSTCHGISAGVGKMGSILGAFGFVYVSQPTKKSELPPGYHTTGIGMRNSLLLLASASMLGFFVSLLMPETKGKSLEELSGETNGNKVESKVSNAENV